MMSRLYIDADVTEADGFVWRFIGFYGEPSTEKKYVSWKALRTLNAARKHPWLCMGDFNEIILSCEKDGGPARPHSCMDLFKEALEVCELTDLGFTGDPFTSRNNSHTGEHYVRERLDRAVADGDWRARFPAFKVTNGDPRHSDHRPVIVDTEWGLEVRRSRHNPPAFRFEAGWVQEEQCGVIVENAWKLTMNSPSGQVHEAVYNVALDLSDWSRNVLGDLEKRIKGARRSLEACRRRPVTDSTPAKLEILKYRLDRLEEKKKICTGDRGRRCTGWQRVTVTQNSSINMHPTGRKEVE